MKKLLLKQKISITLIIISLISLIVIGLSVYFYISKALIENKSNEIFTTAIEQSHESSLVFKNNQIATHMLSTRTRVKEFLLDRTETRRSELLGIFAEYTKENSNYLAIYLLDKSGIGLISTDPRFVGQDYSFRNYFKKAMEGSPTVDVALGKTSNQLGYYFSEPVKNSDGSILGVLVLKVDQKDIDNSITKSALAKDGVIMLVDEFGIIVSTSETNRGLKSLGVLSGEQKQKIKDNEKFLNLEITPMQYDSVYQAILSYKEPIVISLNDKIDGDKELISLVKLDSLPFYLVVEARLNIINNQVFNIVLSVLFIIFIILIIIYFLIFYSIIIFLKPLNKFKKYFESISNGNFLDKITIETHDEFEDMAKYVNDMAGKLDQSYTALELKIKERTEEIEKEKNSLEEKVKDRTKELEEFKTSLEKQVEERTEKLNDKLAELEKINKLTVDRELAMIKLKEEINELKNK